ncbi:unnamed protein product [Symbiodinium sp. CCMP2592]|nr:unnamed protein product [Symbiodinium sp. CCMP2592]
MAPKGKPAAAKGKAAAKAAAEAKAAAAAKKGQQSNMVTQLKQAKKKLDQAMITGEELDPDVKKCLEHKAAFLSEYNSLGLFDGKKQQMLEMWKTDKSLKQWAESKTTHSSMTSVTQEKLENYGTKFDVAKLLNLDPDSKEQSKILNAVLQDLPQDDAWDESNPMEKTFKQMNLVRYTFSKNLGVSTKRGKEEVDSFVHTRDVCGRKLKQMLEDGGSGGSGGSSGDPPAVKLEHVWILPAQEKHKEIVLALKTVKTLVNHFKRFKAVQEKSGEDAPASLTKGFSMLEALEADLLKLQLANVSQLAEEECKAWVSSAVDLLAHYENIKRVAEQSKKDLCSPSSAKMVLFIARALALLIFFISAITGEAVRGDKEPLPTLKRQSEAKSSAAKAKAAKVSESTSSEARPPSLRKKVGETFLHNKLSAKDIFEISQSAAAEAGSSSSVNNFAAAGAGGRQPGNFARDLLRSLCRGAPLELFWYDIPFWDPASDSEIVQPHPFLLPHEVIHHLVHQQGLKSFLVKAAQPAARAQLIKQCDKFGLDPDETISIGMHGDGVPYTKKESLEILSFNFLANPTGDRVPITAVSKKWATQKTWECLLNVITWSLRMLFLKQVSKVLPDGKPWKHRRKVTGQLPGCLLLQCRGDWPFLRSLFYFPAWNSQQICWKCSASQEGPHSYKNTGADALWRKHRVSDHEFLRSLREQNVFVCPLLSLPGFEVSCILLDWLHVVDLGCGADAIGNFFWHLIAEPGFYPGTSREARLKQLWARLRTWYQRRKPASVLDNLTVEMVRRSKATSKPKLKAKGAECRYLVPFCHELATEIAEGNPEDHVMQTIAGLFSHLFALQQWVAGSLGAYDFNKASEERRRFCV